MPAVTGPIVVATTNTGPIGLALLFDSTAGNVTFGLTGSTITASAPAGGGVAGPSIAAGTQTATSGTVVFSNSNGVSFGLNAGTLTASVVAGAGGGINLAVNAATTYTSGTVVLSNGNGVTFGTNAQTVTASVAAGATATGNFGAFAAGTQTQTSGTVLASNSNGVSFGLNAGTLTASVAAGATATGNLGGVAAGTQTATSGTVVFSNGSGVSFGLNAGTVTASVAAGATATGNFGALAAGTQTATSGTVAFVNSNGVTFGLSGSTQVTASHNGMTGLVAAANGSTNTVTQLVFSNSNGVSFGLNGSTITASASGGTGGGGGALTCDIWDNIDPAATASGAIGSFVFTGSHRSLLVAPLAPNQGNVFPADITVSTLYLNASISGSTATASATFSSIFRIAVYTQTGASLSLLNSAAFTLQETSANTTNSNDCFGQRFVPFVSSAWSSSPVFRSGHQYWIATFWSSSGVLNQTGNLLGAAVYSTLQRSGTMGQARVSATSVGHAPFYGIYTATTAAFPSVIANSELNKVAASAAFVPHVMMIADTNLASF